MFCEEVSPNRKFMQEVLGFKVIEQIVLEANTEVASWMSVTPQPHDIALTKDATGSRGRLHHLAYWLDSREDVLRAADILMENDVFIELGPAKHSRTQGFFLYMREPGGNRVELFSGGFPVYAPIGRRSPGPRRTWAGARRGATPCPTAFTPTARPWSRPSHAKRRALTPSLATDPLLPVRSPGVTVGTLAYLVSRQRESYALRRNAKRLRSRKPVLFTPRYAI